MNWMDNEMKELPFFLIKELSNIVKTTTEL